MNKKMLIPMVASLAIGVLIALGSFFHKTSMSACLDASNCTYYGHGFPARYFTDALPSEAVITTPNMDIAGIQKESESIFKSYFNSLAFALDMAFWAIISYVSMQIFTSVRRRA